jgi:hypothetical protein
MQRSVKNIVIVLSNGRAQLPLVYSNNHLFSTTKISGCISFSSGTTIDGRRRVAFISSRDSTCIVLGENK